MTEREWMTCTHPGAMLKCLRGSGRASERKARLFAAAVCRRIWPLLEDERSRQAVAVAELFADGLADKVARFAAFRAASGAGRASEGFTLWRAAMAATYALDAKVDEQRVSIWVAPAVGANAGDAEGAQVMEERKAHADLLRDIYGLAAFRPLPPLAASLLAWNDGTIRRLAEAAYEIRSLPGGTLENARLAVLADGLEDAGCVDAELLGHLRGPGPHVRGCWAIDLLTGRE